MEHATESPTVSGEFDRISLVGDVTERAELLNGSIQLVLEGHGESRSERWQCSSSVSWRIGRAGEVELDEGDIALEEDDRELYGLLEQGTAEMDPDTGSARIRATFTVDGVRGLEGLVSDGDRLAADLDVGAETWSGELRPGAD